MNRTRKEDHIRLAAKQQQTPAENDFDSVEFMHHALAGIDVERVNLQTCVGEWMWQAPIYINGMTGGSDTALIINRTLAQAAAEVGVSMATGSAGIAIDDPGTEASFKVIREHNPHGFVMANIGAGRPADHGQRAVELLGADALQLHLNSVQETVMPEGSREFSSWLHGVEQTVAVCQVPVIVKEVGFGLSSRTLHQLADIGVKIADVSGSGGTNFALIESARGDGAFRYLAGFGQSAVACLLDAPATGPQLLASGGVRTALDAARALALGASAVGVAGAFLPHALSGDVAATVAVIRRWLNELRMLMAMLGAAGVHELTRTDLLIRGRAREFAQLRGIDVTAFSTRSSRRVDE